jgi:hypothetical protein
VQVDLYSLLTVLGVQAGGVTTEDWKVSSLCASLQLFALIVQALR